MSYQFAGLAIVLAMGFSSSAFAIVGGESILPTDAASRSIVNIKMKNGMCTGTAISPTIVLTAAHCRDRFGEVEWAAHIGVGPTETCDVSRVVDTSFYPGAKRELPFRVHAPDILLLKLETPLCNVQPASIQRTPLMPVDVAFGAGHGRGAPVFGQVQRFALQMIESYLAESEVSPIDDTAQQMLSVGAKTFQYALPILSGSSFCDGDSGGPVYREEKDQVRVLGVNSAKLPNQKLGASACDQSYLQIVTPVAPYASWIEAKLSDWK